MVRSNLIEPPYGSVVALRCAFLRKARFDRRVCCIRGFKHSYNIQTAKIMSLMDEEYSVRFLHTNLLDYSDILAKINFFVQKYLTPPFFVS